MLNDELIDNLRVTPRFSYATGFVRPKTTALFFDKLWAPYEIRKTHYGRVYDMYEMPRSVYMKGTDTSDPELFEKIEQNLRQDMQKASKSDLRDTAPLNGFTKMLLSENRNAALFYCSRVFKKYFDIEMTSIMVDKTQYELDVQRRNKRVQWEEPETSLKSDNILELTIHALPVAVDEQLEWGQVVEFRNDRNEVEKLRRFLSWSTDELAGKSKLQIQDELGKTLDDYNYALKNMELRRFPVA